MTVIAWIFGGLLLALAASIITIPVMMFLCLVCRTRRPNDYARDFRLPKQRAPKRTLMLTPERDDPQIVGEMPRFTQAQYPASRANTRSRSI